MRVRGLIAYDGTTFHGWARQPGELATVQASLETALERVVRVPVPLTVAGRTDAGVHAWGQVVSGDVPEGSDLDAIARSLNRMCAPEIAVRDLSTAAPEFSARFDARTRRYVYRIRTSDFRDPFRDRFVWTVPYALDVDAMNHAAARLRGEHDFAAFCKVGAAGGTIRRIEAIEVLRDDATVEIWVEATSYCHQMVRSIAGLLVDIGRGTRRRDATIDVLASRDSQANSHVAPAKGLTLWAVSYPD